MRFAFSSIIATSLDHSLFVILVHVGVGAGVSNLFSQGAGMVVNFILQKQFIFNLKRSAWIAFILSLCFSFLGLLFGSLIVHLLTQLPVVDQFQYLGKIIATGIVFFYNYFTKRFAFERR